jgi:hypothetical protein
MRTIHLPVAEPCHERWDAMEPAAQGRFCQRCTTAVHDVSGLTEPETAALLAANAGRSICVRYAHDAAGNIRHRRPAALAMVAVAALAACTPHETPSPGSPIRAVPGRRIDLDRLIDIDLAPFDDDDRETVGKMVVELPPPPPEPKPPLEVEPPPPDGTHVRMGMVAVQHEPCDPPPADVKPADELPRWNESMR